MLAIIIRNTVIDFGAEAACAARRGDQGKPTTRALEMRKPNNHQSNSGLLSPARKPAPLLGRSLFLYLLIATMIFCPVAQSGESLHTIRELEKAGTILSLDRILRKIERTIDGTVLEAELDYKNNRWIYEILILEKIGIVRELQVDAKTGSLLGYTGGD